MPLMLKTDTQNIFAVSAQDKKIILKKSKEGVVGIGGLNRSWDLSLMLFCGEVYICGVLMHWYIVLDKIHNPQRRGHLGSNPLPKHARRLLWCLLL